MMRGVLFFVLMMMSVSVANATEGQQLSAKEMELAGQMSAMYAQHMYSSSCVNTQKLYNYKLSKMKSDEANQVMANYKKSCDCMMDIIMKTTLPNDVIDFITYMNTDSTPAPGKTKYERTERQKQIFAKMMLANRNQENRKKCGFDR